MCQKMIFKLTWGLAIDVSNVLSGLKEVKLPSLSNFVSYHGQTICEKTVAMFLQCML